MHVSEIIDGKGSLIISVLPGDSVEEASKVLRRAGIGAVLVMDEKGGMAGILSERDIVQGIADHGAEILAGPVSRLMTSEVETTSPGATVDDLMEQMVSGSIRHLPVMEDEALVGIVSVSDVVKNGMHELRAVRDTLHSYIGQSSVRSVEQD